MPAGARIRGNNAFGITTDNPLTIGATTLNSGQLGLLPAVSSAHAVLTLDPLRQFGNPEIVVVTAHGAGATSATIVRGQYGTSARAHPVGTTWVHAPINEDVISIVTSASRPTNPYPGEFIFETDTNKLVGHGGTDWAPRDAGGQIGYAQVVANQNAVAGDLTGLAVAVTVGTGRRIRITGFIGEAQNTSANAGGILRVFEGAVQLAQADWMISTASTATAVTCTVVISPSGGSHTYKLAGAVQNGGVFNLLASATSPAFILVEDIGAA